MRLAFGGDRDKTKARYDRQQVTLSPGSLYSETNGENIPYFGFYVCLFFLDLEIRRQLCFSREIKVPLLLELISWRQKLCYLCG